MKNIVIQDKGNTEFKLTVTPTEVRIKLMAGAPKDITDDIVEFFKRVANKPDMLNCTQTWRGRIRVKDGKYETRVRMEAGKTGNKSKFGVWY